MSEEIDTKSDLEFETLDQRVELVQKTVGVHQIGFAGDCLKLETRA